MGDKKGLRNIILIFIGVLVAIIISLIFLNKKNNNIIQDENNNETISNKNAFCISDNRGKYAVFNAVGKQITKFDFSNECDFYNGSSVVKNDDGQYGIINTSGKFVVKYGKYSHISQIESLYKASNESTNYVLNSKGKEVFKTDDYKFDLDESSDDSNMYKATLSNKIILFDYNGKKIDEINSNSKTSYSDLRCKDLFCEMFIDNKTYIYNLDSKKNLIDKKLLFIGTLNRSIVHPREIFKNAYLLSASSIICVHNHPSGDTIPSKEDMFLTKNLVEIGKMQGIAVVDHIIVGNNYYSFFENGDI